MYVDSYSEDLEVLVPVKVCSEENKVVFTQIKSVSSQQLWDGYRAEPCWAVLTLPQAGPAAHCVPLLPCVPQFPGQDAVPAAPACSLQPAGLVLPLQVVLPPAPAPQPGVELPPGHPDPRSPGHLPVRLHRLHRRALAPEPPR